MRGWIAENSELRQVERPDLAPGQGEVAIRVCAAGINRADLAQAAGGYPPPPGESDILGLECSGWIEQLGDGVRELQVGQAVCALLASGGYADRVICPAPQVAPIPDGLSVTEAAALPEVFATAWLNLYTEGQLQPNERVLLHAGASGVGTAAIQLCRASGNPCFVTAGKAEKVAFCLNLGAEGGAVRGDGDWAEAVQQWATDGVDLILDPVGADYLADNIRLLRHGGRIVLIAFMSGRFAQLDLAALLLRRLKLIGSTLRARPVEEKGRIVGELIANVWPRIGKGEIQPVIEAVYPHTEAAAAHAQMAGNETKGKLLLQFAESP